MKIPTINVNLDGRHSTCSGSFHASPSCAPVLIPCPIPRSVTSRRCWGECGHYALCTADAHVPACPARPVKVACSISGETWAGSEVADYELMESALAPVEMVLAACLARWALVKALVLGDDEGWRTDPKSHGWNLQPQRDAVFSDVATLARLEQDAFEAQERAIRAMGEPTFMPDNFHRAEPHARASASVLERYVERLIEQIGVLP